MTVVAKAAGRPLSKSENSAVSEKIAHNLMETHDAVERDPAELERAALRGIVVSIVEK